MKPIALVTATLAILAASTVTLAAPMRVEFPEPEQTLKPGDGQEQTQSNCAACHSLDYISTQPPGKGAAFWDAEVKKMAQVYGAPIQEADAKTIAAYLAKTY
jgi:sulfite dehydrogenase (cytochrome) subunit B